MLKPTVMETDVQVGGEVHLWEEKLNDVSAVRVVPVSTQAVLELDEIPAVDSSVDEDAEAVGDVVPDGRLVERRADAVVGRQFVDDVRVWRVTDCCSRFFSRAVAYQPEIEQRQRLSENNQRHN